MKVLIVGAHPDDYEIRMAGTIKKHSSRGDEVYAIVLLLLSSYRIGGFKY